MQRESLKVFSQKHLGVHKARSCARQLSEVLVCQEVLILGLQGANAGLAACGTKVRDRNTAPMHYPMVYATRTGRHDEMCGRERLVVFACNCYIITAIAIIGVCFENQIITCCQYIVACIKEYISIIFFINT